LVSGFQLFNASAGSGKTYQLTKSYVKLILINPVAQRFRQILALTFTNKAVAEMKNRILDSLYIFGNPKIDKANNPLFLELVAELGFSAEEMERKSSLALKLLLHNYNFFEVLTIDKFTHRVIKTFAKDLQISQNFEVELDNEMLLDQAIGQLLQNSGEDKSIQKVLIDFSLEKVEAHKSWNIVYDLKNIGKLLFQEDHYAHLKHLENKSVMDFEMLKKFLKEKQHNLSSKASILAQKALDTIHKYDFEDMDFSRQTLPNHFKRILAGERTAKLYDNTLEKGLIQGSVLLKKVRKDGTQLFSELLPIYLEAKQVVFEYLFFKNAYDNVLPLTLLNEISKEVSRLQKEQEILHISEFNKLISKEVANQSVPYIYERLGERYRYYFIDEFQDTSKMQWQNLVPLIGNALETETLNGEKGTLLLVGDGKQSIYRWRGGDPKQFLNLNDKSFNPFTVEPQTNTLQTNWRSFDTIVEFNNAFFTHTANYLKEPSYQKLYLEQCQQQTNHRKGGYVEITFVPKDVEDVTTCYGEKVLNTINRILDQGFSLKDICILVRKNNEGILLANYLAEHAIPIISSEALLLANNPEVQFLVSLIRFLDNPSENIFQYHVLEYLFKDDVDKHNPIIRHLGNVPEFLKIEYGYNSVRETSLPLLDILERAISVFHLSEKCDAYVIHFLDVVQEIGEKSGVGIYEFLSFWDLKKEHLAIAAPLHQDAIELMTIHKSKGLEFPFVIFPFADGLLKSRMHEKKLWVPLLEDSELEFQEVLVNASKELKYCSTSSNELYTHENNLSELDDINVLYVAMTRAIEGLFILTKESNGETYGKLFENYLFEKNLWNPDTSCFAFGNFPNNTRKKSEGKKIGAIPYIYNQRNLSSTLSIKSQSLWPAKDDESIQWGRIVHEILSEINSVNDIEKALLKAVHRGDISREVTTKVRNSILDIVNHPKLSKYYTDGGLSKNEVEIMDAKGQLFRPDRLVFDENQVAIIDYKTGNARPEHIQQVETYATLLQELGFVVTQQILVYIGSKIEPVFV